MPATAARRAACARGDVMAWTETPQTSSGGAMAHAPGEEPNQGRLALFLLAGGLLVIGALAAIELQGLNPFDPFHWYRVELPDGPMQEAAALQTLVDHAAAQGGQVTLDADELRVRGRSRTGDLRVHLGDLDPLTYSQSATKGAPDDGNWGVRAFCATTEPCIRVTGEWAPPGGAANHAAILTIKGKAASLEVRDALASLIIAHGGPATLDRGRSLSYWERWYREEGSR